MTQSKERQRNRKGGKKTKSKRQKRNKHIIERQQRKFSLEKEECNVMQKRVQGGKRVEEREYNFVWERNHDGKGEGKKKGKRHNYREERRRGV